MHLLSCTPERGEGDAAEPGEVKAEFWGWEKANLALLNRWGLAAARHRMDGPTTELQVRLPGRTHEQFKVFHMLLPYKGFPVSRAFANLSQ